MTISELKRFVSVLFLSLATACVGMGESRLGVPIGDRLPPLSLTDYHGNSVTLSQAIEGKVALVRFWSADCALCDHEILQSLDALYRKYQAKGFVPLAIHEGRLIEGDDRFRKLAHVTYPLFVDEDGKAAGTFGVVGLPTTFILDETGIVRERMVGEAGIEAYERLMTTVLYKEGFYDSVY